MINENVLHHEVRTLESTYYWNIETTVPFKELIISFNAERPSSGYYEIAVRMDNGEWMTYLNWSSDEQRSYCHQTDSVQIDQDIISTQHAGHHQFDVRVEAKEGADLRGFYALHASTFKGFRMQKPVNSKSIQLSVEGLSQLCLEDKYAKRICAATSTTAVMRYLVNTKMDPVSFAVGAYDHSFDVFGNWVFNVARANEILGSSWRSWVQRLESFDGVLEQLEFEIPVVVSVKGVLPGSFLPYEKGHLIAVIGYDSEVEEVICMDPAYESDSQTIVRYPLAAFLEVWAARKGLAFIFRKTSIRKL